jgi:hypothetical protein
VVSCCHPAFSVCAAQMNRPLRVAPAVGLSRITSRGLPGMVELHSTRRRGCSEAEPGVMPCRWKRSTASRLSRGGVALSRHAGRGLVAPRPGWSSCTRPAARGGGGGAGSDAVTVEEVDCKSTIPGRGGAVAPGVSERPRPRWHARSGPLLGRSRRPVTTHTSKP